MFDLLLTTRTVAGSVDLDRLAADQRMRALLTDTLLPTEGHPISDRERLSAHAADKTLGMVGTPQRRDHLPCDEVSTAVTLGTVEALVVL